MPTACPTILNAEMPAVLHLNPTAIFSIHPSEIQLSAHEKIIPMYPNLTRKDQLIEH